MDRPQRMEVMPEDIPAALKQDPNWVMWRWEVRDGDWTKPPYQVNGKEAKSNDSTTWTDFKTVLDACRNGGGFDGIGYVLDGGEYTGVDWDDCVSPTGEIAPKALVEVEAIDSYTEFSPSGTGLKTMVRGKLPGRGHHKKFKDIEIGVFNTIRYFCITGNVLPDVSVNIEDRQPQLDDLIRRYWPDDFKAKQDPPPKQKPQKPADLSDQAIIEKALNANDGGKFRRLWNGDISEYDNDDSRADQALCFKLSFWTGKDSQRIDSLFRQSGLMREKWDRDDYRERTIQRAVDLTADTYSGNGQHGGESTHTTPSPTAQARSYNQTDTGNGQRFADQHRENIRYCYPANKWLAWDGTRWKPDSEGLVRQLAKQTTRGIYQEAAREPDSEKSTKIGKWAAASESSFRQESMLKMAQSEPGIPILPEQMDTNHWLLNVQNGIIDLKTRELLPHCRSDLITKIVPVEYDPDATCPKWLEFLYTIMGNDDEMVNYLCRVAGYTLTGDTGEQCLFIFHGSGQNGKSTYLNVMQSILDDYALQTGFDTFTIRKNEGIRNDIARMKTARLVVAIEAGDGKRIDEQVVKQLTGGDKVTARFLHQEHFEFRPQFKVVLAANHRPTIYDQNLAIWRRIRLIPFDVTISDAARINNYERVLLEEKQGILNWMVLGCLEWQQAGLATPERVKVATEEYRSEMDILEDFLDSHCTVGDGLKVTHGILYAAYEGWCEESKEAPFKTRTFAKMMQSRGLTYTKPHNVRTWQGIGIRS
jgi:putative DNA primase/helicase